MKGASVVVHLAAFTHVDRAETETELATRVNHAGTKNVSEAAIEIGARLIYVSTDYVFDGAKTTAYQETDPTNPINVYGRTKLAGEGEAARVPDHWIVRSSWIFGEGHNFVHSVLEHARQGLSLRVVDDQIGRPTSASGLASAIADLTGMRGQGIVHVAGEGEPCSWADLAALSLELAQLDTAIERIGTETYRKESTRVVAPRPPNSTLDLEKARRLGVPLLDWRDSLQREIGAM